MDGRDNIKSTMAEVEQRVGLIVELLTKGYNKSQICRFSSEQGWNVSTRQVERYISEAYDQIKQIAEKNRERTIALAILRYNDLYAKNYKIQDYRECRQVQESINKLLGVNEPDKIDHTTKGDAIKTFTILPASKKDADIH